MTPGSSRRESAIWPGKRAEGNGLRAPLEIHAFEDSWGVAEGLAGRLGAPLRPIDVHRFPDGESLLRVACDGPESAVVVRSLDDPNAKLIEVLLAADALRRRGAERVVLVAPYLAYMRQDQSFREGEAVSQQVVGAQLGLAFDGVVTVEAHLHRIARLSQVFSCPAESLSAAPLVADWCASLAGDWLVVGPDRESEPWVTAVAKRAGLPWIVCDKQRAADDRVRVDVPKPPDGIRGALLVDDIASTGATLAEASQGLRAHGIERVEAVVIHALFAPEAEPRLKTAGVERVVSTDSVAHATNRLSVAPLLAEHLGALHPESR